MINENNIEHPDLPEPEPEPLQQEVNLVLQLPGNDIQILSSYTLQGENEKELEKKWEELWNDITSNLRLEEAD